MEALRHEFSLPVDPSESFLEDRTAGECER